MSEQKPIQIMIHDLNPWGGQDRSMLEIAWQLNKSFPLEIHSYTLEGYNDWPDMEHVQYQSPITKPIVFKYLDYHRKSLKNLKQKPGELVQSTGTASIRSDSVQVQFIHHSWQKIAPLLPNDKFQGMLPIKGVYHSLLDRYKLILEKKAYTQDKHYIAISHAIKKELMEHFNIPPHNINIIHHGVDSDHFKPYWHNHESVSQRKEFRESFGFTDDDVVLLHVGALNARKGIFKALQVMQFLKRHGFSNVKLLAVGQGDQRMIESQIKQLDIKDSVVLAPHSKDIRKSYWLSDVFFFPTYYEPFGLVILEAMACGLPPVTSFSAGASELINHEESGSLFDPFKSPHKISDHLVPLIRNPRLRRQWGEAARLIAEQRSWETVGQEYRQLYQDLMARKTAR